MIKIKKSARDFAKVSSESPYFVYECKCQYFNIGLMGHKKSLAGVKMHCTNCKTYITAVESSIPK